MAGVLISMPFEFIREYTGPLDKDSVFTTTAARTSYLTNARRYAGQVVVDMEDGNIYYLNAARDTWIGFTIVGPTTVNLVADDTPVVFDPNVLYEYLVIQPSSDLAGFKLGTTSGGEEILPAVPITAAAGMVIPLSKFFLGSTTIYFGGCPVNVTVKIYKR
jgi:hypothetical protein